MYDINKEAMESAKRHFLSSRSEDFVKDNLEFISKEEIPKKLTESDLLVNASPVGMKESDGSVIDKDLLHKGLSIYDVVYNRQTQLIKDAKSLGLPCTDGLGMLLYQGAASFEFWTNQKPPIEIMREALNKGVGKI
jgi:shikimate dehydrogenase